MAEHILGRDVPTTLEEVLGLGRTAVLVVDVQNDFCAVGGRAARRGTDLTAIVEALPRMSELLDAARTAGVPVIYVQNTTRPDGRLCGTADLARRARAWGSAEPLVTLEGTWGQAVVDALAPRPSDVIVRKYRQSAFIGTNLEMILRANNWKTAVVIGVETHACVEATARDAMGRDFAVVLVHDCMASARRELHEASLAVMRALLPGDWVTDLAAVRACLAAAVDGSRALSHGDHSMAPAEAGGRGGGFTAGAAGDQDEDGAGE